MKFSRAAATTAAALFTLAVVFARFFPPRATETGALPSTTPAPLPAPSPSSTASVPLPEPLPEPLPATPDVRASTPPAPSQSPAAAPAATPLPQDPFAVFEAWIQHWSNPAVRTAPSPELEAEGLRLALRRRDEMEDLIQSDPRRALELALPDATRRLLPTTIAALVEERVSGRGDLEVLCAIPEPGHESEVRPLQRYVRLGDRRFTAFVYGHRLSQPTLRDVSLLGIALEGVMAVEERPVREWPADDTAAVLASQAQALCAEGKDHPALSPLSRVLEAYGAPVVVCCPDHAASFEARLAAAGTGTLPGATGEAPLAASPAIEGRKRLLFIRVDFSDLQGESFTTNRASDLTRELHRFFQENSYGRAGFFEIGAGSAVTPVFRMPRTAASYGSNNDAGDLRADARQAARNAGYVLSDYDYDLTCMRSVPGFGWAGLGFVGAPGAWIRGTSSTGVTAHELGHNYGLNHANYWDTGGASVTGAGASIEYGDKFDTMGAANAGSYHFNARYKRLLGWLRDGETTVVTTNGTYRLFAHDQTNAVIGARGLQVFANASTNYWVELRQRFTANRWLLNGIGIRWAGRGNQASLLLDTTPGTPRAKDDAAVTLGRTFSDAAAGIHITPITKGGSNPAWIDVVVHRGSFPNNRPPTLSVTAATLSGTTATRFEFLADASDPDGDPIAYHWDFGDEALGANAPSVEHQWASNGDYVVQCTASDMKGGVARASVVIRVGSPSTLRLAGRITADGEPAGGVRVAVASDQFTFSDSDGRFLLTGIASGNYTLTASSEARSFEPVTFTNPIRITANRSDLDFAAVDVAQRRPITLLPAGASWRYWDQGTAPPAAWIRSDFDDTTWNVGPAILGYGGDRETTVVGFGPNAAQKYITTWFRRSFVVDDPNQLAQVRIGLLRDDGAAVYLNGRELFRDNLPAGTLTPETRASSTVGGTSETTYFERDVDLSRLTRGTNLLAVEIHQISPTSSDIAFDLRLTAEEMLTAPNGIRLVRPNPGDTFQTPGRLVLSTAVGELPGPPLHHVGFFADGRLIGAVTNPPFTMTWVNPPAGQASLQAAAILADGSSVLSSPIRVSLRDAQLTPTLVPKGAVWRFLDTGIAPEPSWNQPGFDDSSWLSGPARLGYGEDGEATVVGFGPNPSARHVTTWFRHTFTLPEASTVTNLICRLARDDGAVVYVNGQEAFRSLLPAGPISPTTLALSSVSDEEEVTFLERTLPASNLREGPNVVAVEVHQASRSSSDLGFDLELIAQRGTVPEPPRLVLAFGNGELRLTWPSRFGTWRLESTPALDGNASWQPVPGSPSASESSLTQTVPVPDTPTFFRLAAPR